MQELSDIFEKAFLGENIVFYIPLNMIYELVQYLDIS